MTKYQIAYIASDDSAELMNRSITILDGFFSKQSYELVQDAKPIIFVASGGSEQKAAEFSKNYSSIILLCHRESNSYAATMEIASYLRENGKKVSIIDVFATAALANFVEIFQINEAINLLSKQKAALIGEVSDWLIISDMEDKLIKEKLGVELLRLPWSQLDDYKAKKTSQDFLNFFPKENSEKLAATSKVYSLLEEVTNKYELSAISVECFSMVKRDQVTACLPLSVLNTKKIVAACEGDICSMIGKMMLSALTGLIPWQANVAEIKENVILFAHCTAPLHFLSSFNITTHYETNCGTAIQGQFEKGSVGVFRVNSKLDKYMLLEGEIIDTPNHSFACRTQIEFETTKAQADLLKNNSLGNHHLIFPSEYIPLLEKMMEVLQISRVS